MWAPTSYKAIISKDVVFHVEEDETGLADGRTAVHSKLGDVVISTQKFIEVDFITLLVMVTSRMVFTNLHFRQRPEAQGYKGNS